jgi:hypothetical protein
MVSYPRRTPCFGLAALMTLVMTGALATPAVASAAGDHDKGHAELARPSRIWVDRGPIQDLDLYWANGSPERVPLGPFTFLSEDLGGTNPKAQVRDANGVLWGVKWDEEARSEIAASRLAWAMGLRVDETYYVETARIVFPGGRPPAFQRIGSFIDKAGNFKSAARFKRWVPGEISRGEWALDENPVATDHGYSVLLLMDVIMANWDAKESNTKILAVPDAAGETDWYMIGDYGACFGKMGSRSSHSKYRLKGFLANPPVVSAVTGDSMYLEFKGRNASAHAVIPRAGARFFAAHAAGLTLAQVEDAFRAANAGESERREFAQAVYDRIREVVTKAGD